MVANVFKPRRRKNGKSVESRLYSARVRLPGEHKTITVALHVSDRQVAEAKLQELIRDREREAAGIIAPRRIRDAANKAFCNHLVDYIADLRGRKLADGYVASIEARLKKLASECGWCLLIDVTPGSFQTWRATQKDRAPKTVNDYLAAAHGFFSWLERAELVVRNPLKNVGKVEARGKERRKRRAFTLEELARVVSESGVYRHAILTAYYTGLRRNELRQVEWGDIQQEARTVFIVPRASTTKNREAKRCYLPLWFARELFEAKPQGASGGDRILLRGMIPSMWQYKKILKRAGLSYKDDQGRQADFHALRRSFNTHLAQAAVDPQTRKEMMRHSDIALTLDVYTDKGVLPMAEAVEKLPVFLKQLTDAQIDAQNVDVSGHKLSLTGNKESSAGVSEAAQDEERRRTLALTDITEQNSEKSCLARTRT